MEGIRKGHDLRIHIILMAVTLGIYSIFFLLWSTHLMNLHMKVQRRYEAKLLHWIAAREGAVGVEKVMEKRASVYNFLRHFV
jgi:hypothetical protein